MPTKEEEVSLECLSVQGFIPYSDTICVGVMWSLLYSVVEVDVPQGCSVRLQLQPYPKPLNIVLLTVWHQC